MPIGKIQLLQQIHRQILRRVAPAGRGAHAVRGENYYRYRECSGRRRSFGRNSVEITLTLLNTQ